MKTFLKTISLYTFRIHFLVSFALTNSLADSGSGIHLVAVVALALVAALQVDADLTADAGVHTLVDVCTERGMKRRGVRKKLVVESHLLNDYIWIISRLHTALKTISF